MNIINFLRFFILVLAFCLCGMNSALPNEQSKYLWPIEIKGKISGTFGECRFDHFHAGFDIATNNAVGYKLYAMEDGYVYRLKTSVAGYGKVIYLKMADGKYAVYAHMDKFTPSIENYVREKQHKAGSYEIDLSPEPNRFVFKKGDVIGYSGRSGDVAPHLHLELRTDKEEPVNVTSNGLYVPITDTTPPRLKHLAVKPDNINSTAANQFGQSVFKVTAVSVSEYTVPEKIQVWGKIGLKVSVIDIDEENKYKLAPYKVKLIIDNKDFYSVIWNKISYDEDYNDNFFLYDRELKYYAPNRLKGDYVRLFSLPGVYLNFTAHNKENNGYILCGDPVYSNHPNYLTPGNHRAIIEANDIAGNTSRLSFTISVEAPVFITAGNVNDNHQKLKKINFEPQIKFYDNFFSVLLNTPSNTQAVPKTYMDIDGIRLNPSKQITRNRNTFEYIFAPKQEISGSSIVIVSPDNNGVQQKSKRFNFSYITKNGGVYNSDDGKVTLIVDSNNLDFIPRADKVKLNLQDFKKKLLKVSDIYDIKPSGFQLSRNAILEFKINNMNSIQGELAIFEFYDDTWRFLYPLRTMKENTVATKISHLSTFAVFADSEPPVSKFINPERAGAVLSSNSTILCYVEDLGVGVYYKNIRVKINSKNVPAEYDFETKQLKYKIGIPLPEGKNKITVIVEDRLGLQSINETWFNYKQ